jgi:hypothetical protein
MKKRNRQLVFLGICLCCCISLVNAQQSYSLNGEVRDAETGEVLIGASVAVYGSFLGTVSNQYGFYSLTLKKESYRIVVSYVGYQRFEQQIDLLKNQKINFNLHPKTKEIKEIIVTSEKTDENIRSVQMSNDRLIIKQLESVPVLLGEKDVLKTIQLLPGISTTSEGSSGFSVRGGSFDQNLILLDEAPVYSAAHLLGFFSVFNSEALKDISIYKGGIPAEFGGRASSVLNISMKDGNSKKMSASGGIGLIASRLTLEGPLGKNERTSFIVSGRRSYADIIGKVGNFLEDDMTLYFYDLNVKINHKINNNNRIYLSAYSGKDAFQYEDLGTDWGNSTATLRWNHIWNSKLFSNTSVIYSNYDYGFNISEKTSMTSGIIDIGLKHDFSFYKTPGNTIRYGFNTTYHTFNPGKLNYEEEESEHDLLMEQKQALESAVYFSNYRKVSTSLSVECGLRISLFNQFGEGWQKTYDEENNIIDSTWFNKSELMQSYFEFEPRFSLNYLLNNRNSIKASFSRMAQYLHLISNSTSGQPTDTWFPSTNNIKPLVASQFALGYFQNFKNNTYEFSVETYYKDVDNVTDYEDGTDILLNEDIEAQIISGDGRSYGLEFYLKKKQGRFTGWLSYTLSRTENKIDEINSGSWYPTKNDKKHDLSVVGSYRFNQRLSLAASWVYYTGNAVTFPSGQYSFDGQSWPYYSERNSYRMPNYHRLDFNVHLNGKKKKHMESSWDFSIYNVYNRYNAYTITFDESETQPGTNEATKLSLFGLVPSVSWNFKF